MAYSSSSSPLARASDNRFARITTTDQGATLWVVTLLSMIYAILVLAVRLGFTKWRAHTWDDFVVVVAHLLAFSMWAFLFSALKRGLGKSYSILEDAEISKTQELFYTSCILLYIALAFSKVSILMLIRSVFARNVKVSILAIGTGVVVVVLGLIGAIATRTECSVDTVIPKPGDEYCVDLIPWLKAITVGDMITEVIIMALPIIGFHSSLMSIKSKFIVVMAFFTRIPNVVFALMHFLAYAEFVESRESAIRIVPTVAWQSVLLSFNLISATTPLLKGFTQGFMTQGVSLGYLREGTTGGGSGMSGGSYELKSLTKSTRSKSKFSSLKLTPSDAYATTTVEGNSEEDTLPPSRLDRLRGQESSRKSTLPPSRMDCMRGQRAERASIASQESQKIMIKQEWQISAA